MTMHTRTPHNDHTHPEPLHNNNHTCSSLFLSCTSSLLSDLLFSPSRALMQCQPRHRLLQDTVWQLCRCRGLVRQVLHKDKEMLSTVGLHKTCAQHRRGHTAPHG